MDSIVAFVGKFIFVYLLGRQTINIVAGHKLRAFFVSLLIGLSEIFVIRAVIQATESGDWVVYFAAVLGGSFGILAAMIKK